MQARLALAVVLLTAWSIVAPAQRLPNIVIPEHYDLHLAPDFSTDTFAGRVAITVRLTEPSRWITLNAAEIDFHETTIASGGAATAAAVTLDAQKETATLTVPQEIPAGLATIAINYTGRLNDQLRGFYLSRANGRDYAVTQLEATDARRAFPAFDEPAFKATFAVSATIDARDTAIANGRLLSDTPGPGAGKHTLKFATTERMSPYLVALAVGDWACIAGSADRIPIRVCATPSYKDQLGYALESAEFALKYFNRYFAIKYPFEKLDLLGVPDFSAGAMENTGAIFFREQYLVVPNDGGTVRRRKQIAQFVGHEIAHQWFGDLVTMAWWDDIWLNEGFATWMEYRPVQEAKPEWQGPLIEVRDTQRAMELDSLRATRPVRTKVETPDEINEVFDAIAYQKTAAVIRMVEGYVGPANYRDGINAYLKKFAYGNATGEGLWTTLAAVTHKPVDRVMQSFVTQSSMPLVTIETRCAGRATELMLAQRPMSDAVPASTLWDIPVCYKRDRAGKTGGEACTLLSAKTETITLPGCSSWIFANVDSRGYYRTSYDRTNLRAIGEAVVAGRLTSLEQTTLLEDLWALVRRGDQNIAEYLSLSSQLAKAQLSPAIATALYRINYISEWIVDEPQRASFQNWVRNAVRPLMDRLGWAPKPGDSDEINELRSIVLFTMGNAGRDRDVLREARRLAELHVTNARRLHPSLADTTLELAALEGDAALYEQYLSRMRGAASPNEHLQYLAALSFFTNAALQTRTLDYATSPDIRTQDAPMLIRMMLQRPWAAAAAWDHVKARWDHIERSFGIFQGIPTVVGATQHLCDVGLKEDVERFFEARRVSGIDRTVRQSIETIQRCTATKAAQSGNLDAFLAGH
ncbi:MAG TPA: M1 family metallopeptidase [Vicinamibacterales bacterium]|nr:M1 family metallopeptidase [Vicinamibacterales bacterium]